MFTGECNIQVHSHMGMLTYIWKVLTWHFIRSLGQEHGGCVCACVRVCPWGRKGWVATTPVIHYTNQYQLYHNHMENPDAAFHLLSITKREVACICMCVCWGGWGWGVITPVLLQKSWIKYITQISINSIIVIWEVSTQHFICSLYWEHREVCGCGRVWGGERER